MRWIFFCLLTFNGLAFVWGIVFEKESAPARSTALAAFKYSQVPSLQLSGEVKGQGQVLRDVLPLDDENAPLLVEGPGEMEVGSNPETDGRLLCEIVGPFSGREASETFTERLASIEVASAVKEIRLPAGKGYRLYLEPAANRRVALRKLADLQARNVDSFVIPKGELENGISLGMFSQENLATARFEELKGMGLTPILETFDRTYREIWVMLEHGEEQQMSDISWVRVMKGFNKLERRQNFCLDVASGDNFQ